MNLEQKLTSVIRDVPDFPKKGILFKDITPILLDSDLVKETVEALVCPFLNQQVDAIAGVESRGYLFGLLMSQRLGVPFIMIRKEGKLPAKTIKQSYELEYGSATIEVHEDAIETNANIVVHDDLLATGGTAQAAAKLISQKANIVGFSFLIDLPFLKGSDLLKAYSTNIQKLISF